MYGKVGWCLDVVVVDVVFECEVVVIEGVVGVG